MLCQEFEAVLEQADSQPLTGDAAVHASGCENCRALIADLETIQALAHELTVPDTEPPARVWTQIRAQLEDEGIIRTPESVADSASVSRGWLAGFSAWVRRPALVATYAALMVLAAGLAWEKSMPTPSTSSDIASLPSANTQNNLNQLEAQTVNDLQTSNPDVNAALQRDLKIVNNFIAVCEKAVREEPQDETARQYLYGAYQQKSELLAAAMAHSRTGE
jgi:hypothetical protein